MNQMIPWIIFICSSGAISLSAQEPLSRSFDSPVIALSVSVDQQSIFAGSGGSVFELNRNLEIKKQIKTELDFVCDIRSTKDHIILAGGSPSEHGMIELYGRSDWKLQKRKLLHDDVIQSIELVNDQLITAAADSKVRVVRQSDLETLISFGGHSKRVSAVVAIAGTEWVVSGGLDDSLKIWSSTTGKIKRELSNHQDDVLDLKLFVSDASEPVLPLVASVSLDRTVRFWQPTIGRLVRFKRFDSVPTCCCWVPGTDRILVGFANGMLIDLSSTNLETREILNAGDRIFSLAILSKTKFVVGTRRDVLIGELK